MCPPIGPCLSLNFGLGNSCRIVLTQGHQQRLPKQTSEGPIQGTAGWQTRTEPGTIALGATAISSTSQTTGPPPGTPPAFGTGPRVGPEVYPATFAESEKLVQVELSERERAVAAKSWRSNMASLYERRTGPRNVQLESSLATASR